MVTILWVEPNEQEWDVCRAQMEDADRRVVFVTNGAAALKTMMTHRLNLVILDPNMGSPEGALTLQAIKELDASLPVLLYTDESLFGDDFRYFLADACLLKSANLAPLKQKICEVLGQANPAEQHPIFTDCYY